MRSSRLLIRGARSIDPARNRLGPPELFSQSGELTTFIYHLGKTTRIGTYWYGGGPSSDPFQRSLGQGGQREPRRIHRHLSSDFEAFWRHSGPSGFHHDFVFRCGVAFVVNLKQCLAEG